MATITSDEVQTMMAPIIRNPNMIQKISLDLVERLTNGDTIIVEPSNPVVYSLEMGAILAGTTLTRFEAGMRKQYPIMAQNEDDLYRHMADADYLNRFSRPGQTTVGFVMPLVEIYGKAVPLRDGTGASLLTIPKHTTVTLGEYAHTLQYPLQIKVLYNGTLSIYTDVSDPTPTYQPITNDINYHIVQAMNTEWIIIEVPMQQVKISSQVIQVTSFTGFSRTLSFEDYFYYARAYRRDPRTATWQEIHVTHNQQIYDSKQPTVCLRVLNQSLSVYIPQIYFENGSITDALRLDVYTTKGPATVDLTAISESQVKVKFNDLDNTSLNQYSAPLEAFSSFSVIPRSELKGGAGPLTFAELRRRVTARSAVTAGLPITTNQLGSALKDAGFDMITNLDNITDRQYVAVRQVDPPEDATTVTGLGCTVQLVELTIDEIVTNTGVIDNNQRVTIPPQTLFVNDGGYIKIVPKDKLEEYRQLAQTSPDGIANLVNTNQFYFTPFHYVLDTTNNTFQVRPYHMTSPTVLSRYIFNQNDGLGLNIRSNTYSLGMNPDGSGYSLLVELEVNDSLKSIGPELLTSQLSYTPKGSLKRAHIAGRLISLIDQDTGRPVGEKWIYQYDFKTSFDLNSNHELLIDDTGYPVELEQELDIVFVIKNFQPNGAGVSDIDQLVSIEKIPDYDYLSTYLGTTQEKIVVQFGKYLKHLWHRSRTIVDSIEYLTYEEDIPAYYTQDVYKRGPDGNIIVEYDYDTSTIKTYKLFSKGDPVIDEDGKQVIRYRKGDYIRGPDQQPIPKTGDRGLARQIDLFLVDGRYFFATNENTLEYLQSSLNQITKWITEDIAHLQQRLLERTDLYFYPKSSVGLIDVIVGDGTRVRMNADQRLVVTYTLRKEKYNNPEIRDNLRDSTPATILKALTSLQQVTGGAITLNDVLAAIKRVHGEDIIDVNIKGFLEDKYTAVLVTDMSSVPSIGKKLTALSNLTLQVQDDVAVEWKVLDSDQQNYRFAERKES